MKAPSARLDSLRDKPAASVVIVGGGINGIATFRDLALQGVDVVLVERKDFCSGASAASSHMVHGGIRYLENGELRLVRESLAERNRLLATAPHYVRPLKTTIPIFSLFSGLLSAPIRLFTHAPGNRKSVERSLSRWDSCSMTSLDEIRGECRGIASWGVASHWRSYLT